MIFCQAYCSLEHWLTTVSMFGTHAYLDPRTDSDFCARYMECAEWGDL